VSGLVLLAPALQVDEKSFLSRLDLGGLLRFGVTRALIGTDGPGLHYVRQQIYKRRDAVLRVGAVRWSSIHNLPWTLPWICWRHEPALYAGTSQRHGKNNPGEAYQYTHVRGSLDHSRQWRLSMVSSPLVLQREFGMRGDETSLDDASIQGYLRPMRAHDWDRGSLLMYRSFNLSSKLPDYNTLKVPIMVSSMHLSASVSAAAALESDGGKCIRGAMFDSWVFSGQGSYIKNRCEHVLCNVRIPFLS